MHFINDRRLHKNSRKPRNIFANFCSFTKIIFVVKDTLYIFRELLFTHPIHYSILLVIIEHSLPYWFSAIYFHLVLMYHFQVEFVTDISFEQWGIRTESIFGFYSECSVFFCFLLCIRHINNYSLVETWTYIPKLTFTYILTHTYNHFSLTLLIMFKC